MELLEAELRRTARPLPRRDWWEVITSEVEHATVPLLCDNCGEETLALLYCGVVLCVPCWRKKARRDGAELLLTFQAYIKSRPASIPLYLRFVTFTIQSGHDLSERVAVLLDAWARLRRRVWWSRRTRGAVLKVEVTWAPGRGWHAHLHVLQVGSYLPQDELAEKWEEATRGEGRIVDVRGRLVRQDAASWRGLLQELAKYVAKPTAPLQEENEGPVEGPPPTNARDEVLEDVGRGPLPLEAWPRQVCSELAALLAGGSRTRWWCPTHLSASWSRCQDGPLPGLVKLVCEGAAFRVELTGFRRLRWYGDLREIHRTARAAEAARVLEARCQSCGKGVLRSLRTFEAWARYDPSWLTFIQGHKSTDGVPARTVRPSNPWVLDPLQATLHLWSSDRPPPGGRP